MCEAVGSDVVAEFPAVADFPELAFDAQQREEFEGLLQILKDGGVILRRGQSRKAVQCVGGFDAQMEREQTGCVRDRAGAVEL